jgi:hypothetical protein
MVPPGTAGDFDGDGLIGTAEDTDNATDRVFGTLTAALGAANGGAGLNGQVLIVTSGRFPEQLNLSPLGGVTILEAAPGVQANLDAVLQGDAGNATRQAGIGITINEPTTNRSVILRNLVIRNFQVGLRIGGNARVTLTGCRFDSNVQQNVLVTDSARLIMTNCEVTAAGMRFPNPGAGGANPGDGIDFRDFSGGSIVNSTISSNTNAGIRNGTRNAVLIDDNNIFDNGNDLLGRFRDPSFGFGF